jgi:hypothetical protein
VNDQKVTTQALDITGHDGTIYVHLCNGDVEEVTDVVDIALTDTHLFLTLAEGVKVFDRRDIYFCCCEPGAEPSAY